VVKSQFPSVSEPRWSNAFTGDECPSLKRENARDWLDGSPVPIFTMSAAFDPTLFERPQWDEEFCLDRV